MCELKIIGDYKAWHPISSTCSKMRWRKRPTGSRTLAVALNYGSQQEIARAAAQGGSDRAT